ncbi:hypothetical protein [Paraburkholderia sacchari]|uniref:hypothetical protein n=1 Tax=Paraburkholderia sacchari TaxID=159450 RepID=UPI001BCDC4A9|nr:hypothetical protein [Paraburkholderia sacchari]
MTFKFEMNSAVTIAASSETGTVVGRAEYAASESSYLVRYQAADGRAIESWWGESALTT